MAAKIHSIFDPAIIVPAIRESFKKLNPVTMLKNPVMFVTEVGAVITTILMFTGSQGAPFGFLLQITLWLWFTVLFANFAEAMAEGRGKAQADSLRKARTQTFANRIKGDAIENVARRAVAQGRSRSSLRRESSSPVTARSSKVPRRWTNPQLPASPLPSCARPEATAAPLRVARACCPT